MYHMNKDRLTPVSYTHLRLKWEGSKGHFYKVSYPDGRQAYTSKLISQPEAKWRDSLKQDVESIIETAYTMIGIPYLWAGRCV